jgi:uncharacterized membrane protein YoaK (UPF0700 family)
MFIRIFNFGHYSKANILIWSLFAFQAGAINAGGFLSSRRFVSHITGFATFFGADFASNDFYGALSMATVPIFFLIGTMISAHFIDNRIAKGKTPKYTLLMVFILFLMILAAFGGESDWFGTFGGPLNMEPSYSLLAILCLACGIQNASISTAAGTAVRTTHLTGITTDLGIGLMRMFAPSESNQTKEKEKRANAMRFGIIFAFILGSTVASYFFMQYGFQGFLLPAAISCTLLSFDLNHRSKKIIKARNGVRHG